MAVVRKWRSEPLGVTIEVDYGRCTGAGRCAEVCPSGVYQIVDGKATCPNIDECVQCCACVDSCPNSAISHSSCGK